MKRKFRLLEEKPCFCDLHLPSTCNFVKYSYFLKEVSSGVLSNLFELFDENIIFTIDSISARIFAIVFKCFKYTKFSLQKYVRLPLNK